MEISYMYKWDSVYVNPSFQQITANLQSSLPLEICTFRWLDKFPVVWRCHFLLQLHQYVFHGKVPLPICQHSELLWINLFPNTSLKNTNDKNKFLNSGSKTMKKISRRNHCNKMEIWMAQRNKLQPRILHFNKSLTPIWNKQNVPDSLIS